MVETGVEAKTLATINAVGIGHSGAQVPRSTLGRSQRPHLP